MRVTSFRARSFMLGIGAAAIIVGAALISTYVVVASGMQDVAETETARLAERATAEVRMAVTRALVDARAQGLSGEAAIGAAELAFSNSIPERFGVAQGFLEGHFAFWDPKEPEPQYVSSQQAVVDDVAGRATAVATAQSVSTHVGGGSLFSNLLLPADLGTWVVHVPFERPNGTTWVLDVIYEPRREAEAMERIRPPMLLLSAMALGLTLLVMRLMTNWVLRLVDQLRVAAESVDAEMLDVRLPDLGSNEIGDLARSLNGLLDRLRRRAEMQTRFVADASHELATPVAGIRGYVGILKSWGADEPEVREEALEAIDRESTRMVRLTRQLLGLIRSEKELEFQSIHHDINAVVRQVLADAATRYSAKGLEFIGPEKDSLILYGDPDRMEDIVSILVDNAAKYTQADGTIMVKTLARKGDVVLEVSDSGPGIPPDDLPNIFERFYRSDRSRSDVTGGFGLGLAIAKQLVESAGGLIDVSSEQHIGTTFTVRVPRGRG
jgi:signal transduction histidine kinase